MGPADPVDRIRASCLVNNHDYGRFVVEAVRSALEQTRPFDEIIVVDDGSTDDSVARLREAFSSDDRVRVVAKENEGQLSCFNRGLSESSGDLLCFLDADDVFDPGYLATLESIYLERPDVHFVVSAHRTFGREERVVRRFPEDRELGYSAVLALTRSLTKLWVSPTSTLSMRRRVADRILPIPLVDDWRTRADDCLLFGSALAGARKYFSAKPLVGYRVHGENQWYGRTFDQGYEASREAALDRLLSYLHRRLGLEGLASRAHEEFGRIESPDLRQLRHYGRIAARAPVGLPTRLRMLLAMVRHWSGV